MMSNAIMGSLRCVHPSRQTPWVQGASRRYQSLAVSNLIAILVTQTLIVNNHEDFRRRAWYLIEPVSG